MSKKASNPPPPYPKPPAPAVTPPPPRNVSCGAPGFVVDLRGLVTLALSPGDRLAPDATIEVAGRRYKLGPTSTLVVERRPGRSTP